MNIKEIAKELIDIFDPPLIRTIENKRYVVTSKRVTMKTAKGAAIKLRNLLKFLIEGDKVEAPKKRRGRLKKEK